MLAGVDWTDLHWAMKSFSSRLTLVASPPWWTFSFKSPGEAALLGIITNPPARDEDSRQHDTAEDSHYIYTDNSVFLLFPRGAFGSDFKADHQLTNF